MEYFAYYLLSPFDLCCKVFVWVLVGWLANCLFIFLESHISHAYFKLLIIVDDDLVFLIFLPLPSNCWSYSHAFPYLVYLLCDYEFSSFILSSDDISKDGELEARQNDTYLYFSLQELRHSDCCKFEDSLSYIVRPCVKKT